MEIESGGLGINILAKSLENQQQLTSTIMEGGQDRNPAAIQAREQGQEQGFQKSMLAGYSGKGQNLDVMI